MVLIALILVVFATWRWGDWKNWHIYHTTMLFACLGNFLYNFIYFDQLLWKLKPDFFNFKLNELIYILIILPLTSLIFLSNYPKSVKGQFFRIIKFIAIYISIELIYLRLGRIVYDNGWSSWWSLAWNCMMFPLLALHHKKPLTAYIVSLITIIIVLLLFPPYGF